MNRPPFNKRELRRLSDALFYAWRDKGTVDSGDKKFDRQAARDAAAFARLRAKVEGMIQEKKR